MGIESLSGDTMVTVLSASKMASKSISSDASVSSNSSPVASGGVGARSLAFLLCFDFFGMIELAQDTGFLRARLDLRDFVFSPPSPSSSSSSGTGEVIGDSIDADNVGSEAAVDSVRTEGSLRRDSKRKKLRRLAGAVGEVGLVRADEVADDGRFRSVVVPSTRSPRCISRIAPAVLGRESSSTVVLSDGRPVREDCGLEVPLMTDDRLFVAEWPWKVDRDVSVSEDMVDSGRMYSTVSEKPTRARDGGRGML